MIEYNAVYETSDGMECTRGTTFSTYQYNTLFEFRDRGANAPYSQGIECAGGGNDNNVIQFNMIKGYSEGMQLNSASNLTVLGNTIAGTTYDITTAGANKDRPQFDALLRAVARKEFDVVAAWSVDRLGRSLQDLVGFLSDLQSKKIDLYLHQQALDTSTPAGKAMYGMLGVFAEFERSIIQERVKAGLARARAKGTTFGRPKADAWIEERIRELAAQGMGKVKMKIAKTLGIGVSLTQRVLA